MNRPGTDAQDQLLQIITFGLQRAAGPYLDISKSGATEQPIETLNRPNRSVAVELLCLRRYIAAYNGANPRKERPFGSRVDTNCRPTERVTRANNSS